MSASQSYSRSEIEFHDCGGYYRGSAKVPLSSLEFIHDRNDVISRTFSKAQAERLLGVFEKEGCYPLKLENRIPALIPEQIIDGLLQQSTVAREDFMQYTVLPDPILSCHGVKFRCLRGRHRSEAAKWFLPRNESWWAVDFYSEDLPVHLKNAIRARFYHSQPFSDGDIYRNLRSYQSLQNAEQTDLWMNRFGNKKTDIKTLGQEANSGLRQAFDNLLPFVGLWADFRAGMLKRVLTMKCNEELINYLTYIHRVWSAILGVHPPWHLDSGTVRSLHLLSPAYALDDRSQIISLFINGEVFQTIPDRMPLLSRVLAVRGRIPSLFSFLEDTKYIEPSAKAMRLLIPPVPPKSIKRTMRNFFVGDGYSVVIEHAESAGGIAPQSVDSFRLAYLQVWLFALRNFTEPRLDDRKLPRPQQASRQDLWTRFASFAYRKGFITTELDNLRQEDPMLQQVTKFLEDKFPYDEYIVPDLRDIARKMLRVLPPLRRRPQSVPLPYLSHDDRPLNKNHLHGRPFFKSHATERVYLFLPFLYGLRNPEPKLFVTSFAVRRDIFFCFFGYPETGDVGLFERFLPSLGAEEDHLEEQAVDSIHNIDSEDLHSDNGDHLQDQVVDPIHNIYFHSDSGDHLQNQVVGPIHNIDFEEEYQGHERPLNTQENTYTDIQMIDAPGSTNETVDDQVHLSSHPNADHTRTSKSPEGGTRLERYKVTGARDFGPFHFPLSCQADIDLCSEIAKFPLILYNCGDRAAFLLAGSEQQRYEALQSITNPRDNHCHYTLVGENSLRALTVSDVYGLVAGLVLIGQERKIRIIDDDAKKKDICFLRGIIGDFDIECLAELETESIHESL